jgi:hypothetical protein
MPYVLFHDYFPEVAERETRTIFVLGNSEAGLPPGHYSFLEMFCNEPGCDCRRVFFYVVSSLRKDVEAVVAYGWESPNFYARWMKDDNPHVVANLKGPILNLGSPQSTLAPAILEGVRNMLLQDDAYVERVKRHYRTFRDRIDGKESVELRKKIRSKKNRRKG